MVNLVQLLKFAVEQNASDIHISAGTPPSFRIDGRLVRVKMESLNGDTTRRLCYSVLNDFQKGRFEENREIDFSFEVTGISRFRANLFLQKSFVSGVFRRVPVSIPTCEQLGLPVPISELTNLPYGLVLVVGPTGSGKSTTLASMIDKVNREQFGHIVTLEDPIEFVHTHKNCVINQREVGSDTESFKDALRYMMRQDPDYCLVGELRDLETVDSSLTLAETGHLVFGTLHTNSASQTISRMVSMYPSEQQDRVRTLLSFVLQGIVSQRLLPKKGGGRVAALEFLSMTPNIRNLVRENKFHQIESMMQIGQGATGMTTLNQALVQLVSSGKVELDAAMSESSDPDQMIVMLKKMGAI